jgi:hypothetical protein
MRARTPISDDVLESIPSGGARMRDVLTKSGHVHFTIQVFDGDDHGMRDATGTLDPRYLDTTRKWLASRVR